MGSILHLSRKRGTQSYCKMQVCVFDKYKYSYHGNCQLKYFICLLNIIVAVRHEDGPQE